LLFLFSFFFFSFSSYISFGKLKKQKKSIFIHERESNAGDPVEFESMLRKAVGPPHVVSRHDVVRAFYQTLVLTSNRVLQVDQRIHQIGDDDDGVVENDFEYGPIHLSLRPPPT
jgi:hypothetical protein